MQVKTYTTARLVTDIVIQQILWDYLPALDYEDWGWTDWINNHCGEGVRKLLHDVETWELPNCIEDLIGDVDSILPYFRHYKTSDLPDNCMRFPVEPIIVTVGDHLGNTVFDYPEQWLPLLMVNTKNVIGARKYQYIGGETARVVIPVELDAMKDWINKEKEGSGKV